MNLPLPGLAPNLRFAAPWAFLLLLLVPLLIHAMMLSRRRNPVLRIPSVRLFGLPRRTLRLRLRPLPSWMLLAAYVLMVVALARPQSPWQEQKRKTEGISIMLVFDTSESMRALDYKPDRLTKAKELTREFVKRRVDDLIGIVIFGKETFTLCPLTHDYDALDQFIARIDYDLVDGNGTAIGMGLANGVNKLKDAKTKSKVCILLTDGENNWGEIQPLTAAEIAQKLKIRVYTIGVGSQGIVDMPVKTSNGRTRVVQYPSSIDTETLKKIADMTGGQFFEATNEKQLQEIYTQIDQMERTRVDVNEHNFYDELAHWMIVPALLLFLLAFGLELTWLRSFP